MTDPNRLQATVPGRELTRGHLAIGGSGISVGHRVQGRSSKKQPARTKQIELRALTRKINGACWSDKYLQNASRLKDRRGAEAAGRCCQLPKTIRRIFLRAESSLLLTLTRFIRDLISGVLMSVLCRR